MAAADRLDDQAGIGGSVMNVRSRRPFSSTLEDK
jgi:hypothetical protein